MAEKRFITDINLKGNQIKEVVAEILSSAPEAPVKGRFYYDSTDNKFKYYNGSAWIAGAEYKASNKAVDQEGTQYGVLDEQSGTSLVFRVIKTEDSRLKLTMSEGVIKASLDMKYKSSLPDDLTMPNAVGGIAKGTSVEDLKAKTVDQVLDDLLFPEVQPSVQNPSASLAFKAGFSNNGVYEVGATAPNKDTNFTPSFNRGTVTCPGKPNQNRAGELIDGESFIYYNNSESNKDLPATIQLGQMQYNYKASYGAGDTLITSKGNKATIDPNPLPAGSIKSGSIYVFGTYPYYCNGQQSSANLDTSYPSEAIDDTKLTLVKWTETKIYAKFASEASTGKRVVFKFPATKRVTKVQVMNDLNGSWGDFADVATEQDAGKMTVQGQQVDYKSITTNGDMHGNLHLCFIMADR